MYYMYDIFLVIILIYILYTYTTKFTTGAALCDVKFLNFIKLIGWDELKSKKKTTKRKMSKKTFPHVPPVTNILAMCSEIICLIWPFGAIKVHQKKTMIAMKCLHFRPKQKKNRSIISEPPGDSGENWSRIKHKWTISQNLAHFAILVDPPQRSK